MATTGFVAGVLVTIDARSPRAFPVRPIVVVGAWLQQWADIGRIRPIISTDVSDDQAAPCPDDALVVVTGGQSNAANSISTPLDATPAAPLFMFMDGRCYLLRDPLLGASGVGGSIWSRLGPKLHARTGRPILFVNGAIGGSRFADWMNPASPHFSRLQRNVAAAERIAGPVDLILWHQGETDAALRPARSRIEKDIRAVLTRLLHELPIAPNARILLYRASRCAGVGRENGVAEIIAAQTAATTIDPRVIAGPNTDKLDQRQRWDGCHFNEAGAEAVAQMTMESLFLHVAAPPQVAAR